MLTRILRGFKIKITQTLLRKNFTVEYKGKTYYAEYANSDSFSYYLLNRDYWEILDEELEELNTYVFKDTTKEEKKQIEKNAKLYYKLISFCIKHFNDYKPELEY